jgi:hypothetical protein
LSSLDEPPPKPPEPGLIADGVGAAVPAEALADVAVAPPVDESALA